MAETDYKIIDVWINENEGVRTNPDEIFPVTSPIHTLPMIYLDDTVIFRFRISTGPTVQYNFASDSELNLNMKENLIFTDILAAAVDADFVAAHWPSDDTYDILQLKTIVGVFGNGVLVTGTTSTATASIKFDDITKRSRIFVEKTTGGPFVDTEVLTETTLLNAVGATAVLDGGPVNEVFDRTKGKVACIMTFDKTLLKDRMANTNVLDVVFELMEKFTDKTERTVGHFAMKITKDIFKVT